MNDKSDKKNGLLETTKVTTLRERVSELETEIINTKYVLTTLIIWIGQASDSPIGVEGAKELLEYLEESYYKI